MKFLNYKNLTQTFGYSKSTIQKLVKLDCFPKPHNTGKLQRWLDDEITAFMIFLTQNKGMPLPKLGKERLEEIKTYAENLRNINSKQESEAPTY